MFGELLEDLTWHDYLALRVRAGGDPRTRNSYYLNLQVAGQIKVDLWQHRLYFKADNLWEELFVGPHLVDSSFHSSKAGG